jgi:hypothetical protein
MGRHSTSVCRNIPLRLNNKERESMSYASETIKCEIETSQIA